MKKNLLYVLVAINSANLLASDKETPSAQQPQPNASVDSRTQAEKDVWNQRTKLQHYLMTPSKHDQPASQATRSSIIQDLSPAAASQAIPHGQWCEYHDRSETCDACAVPAYYYDYGRNGNDSQ